MRPPARPRLPEVPPTPAAPAGRARPPAPPVVPPSGPSAVPAASTRPPVARGPRRPAEHGTDVERAPEPDRALAGWSPRRAPVVSPASAERFAERVRQRRRIRRDHALAWAGGLLVVGGFAWVAFFSPVLALHADAVVVRVEGDQAVVDAASVTALATAHDRTPLPRLDTVALRRAILDVPGVRAASIARDWPHGLTVTVVARDPVGAVPADGGFALVDAEGVQVGRTDAAPQGVPVVNVPIGDGPTLTAVLLVLQQLPAELSAQVGAVSAANPDAVRLDLVDGTAVEWGSADQSALKAKVLLTLRASGATAGATTVDVSAPTLPITRS